jgi:hypothetical protein
MHRYEVEALDASKIWWVPNVRAPARDWAGAPGCRRGARFLIDERSCRPSRDDYACFASRGACLEWIMAHRAELARTAPGAAVAPVDLAKWLLGLA